MLFCAIAVVAAAVCLRLGFWQLARLREKVQRNAVIERQQRANPVRIADLARDTTGAHYRPVTVSGDYDYANELVVSGRTHQGSPGVELLTPVRLAGSDTAVLVNRGWVYSPDGSSVDHARWREAESAAVIGYVQLYAPDAGTTAGADPRLVRRVSRSEIASKIPYPVAPYYVVQVDTVIRADRPARRAWPTLDDGPHRGYAMQWFAFAVIAIVGAGVVVMKERTEGR
jgi:surfeit locus 1 family protein